MKARKIGWNNWLLLLGAIVLAAAPLVLIRDSEFEGADGKATSAIAEVQPEYEPWFKPLIEPPGTETESFLFALQAAIGAGTIGYVIGLYQGRSRV